MHKNTRERILPGIVFNCLSITLIWFQGIIFRVIAPEIDFRRFSFSVILGINEYQVSLLYFDLILEVNIRR